MKRRFDELPVIAIAVLALACGETTQAPRALAELRYNVARVVDLDSLGTDARDVVESGGLLWVLTDHEPFVTVLDSAGRVAERFGARGRGPRDLLAPWSIVAGPRDAVPWIYDAGKHAMLQLPRRALDARSVAIRTVLGFVRADFREITYGDIAAVFRSSTGFIAPVYRGDGTVTRSLLFPALVSYSETGEPLDTLVDFLKAPPDTSGIGGALDLVPIPLFAGCGTDTVYMYDGYSDGIERVTRAGERVRIADVPASLLEWRVPTREDRVRYVRGILEAEYEGAPPPPDLEARAERLASNDVARFTTRLPRFTRLRCGPNGSLLLQGFDLADNRVGYGSDWYVFTGSKELSRVTLPDRFEPRAVRGDTLLGLLFDEEGRASVALAVASVLAHATPPDAPVRWDPTAKVYWVAVRIEDGSIRQMRVEPANRAVATLRLEQVDRGDAVDYQYLVGADSSSPKTVSQIAVPCPPDGGITARTGGDWQSMSEWRGTLHCEYTVYAARGQGQVDVALRSTLLAGVGEAIVVGAGGAPLWPTEDPTEETIALGPLVDSLSGAPPNGLVGRMPAPVPKYERRVVAQTDSGLQILAHELRRICEGTRWIADPATCRQLEQRLPLRLAALRQGGAPPALGDDARAEIRRQLDEFIRVLVASREVTVDQNAFTILHAIAGVVRAPLVPASP